jgi:hypothetical protein
MNRSRSQRLSGNERGSGLPRDGEKNGAKEEETSAVDFFYVRQRRHADGKPVRWGRSVVKLSTASVGFTSYAVGLN